MILDNYLKDIIRIAHEADPKMTKHLLTRFLLSNWPSRSQFTNDEYEELKQFIAKL